MASETPTLIDRASAYGDGVFETIAIRDGKARFWPRHVDRLQTSCARLGINCPTTEKLAAIMRTALGRGDACSDFATARLVVAASDSPRGYRRTTSGSARFSIDLFDATPLPKAYYTGGVTVRRCNLRLAIQPALAGIKSLNRLEQVLARAEWDAADIFEGLMLDLDGRLICGTMSNVFIVVNSTVITPALTRCGVSGIMRAQVLQLLAEAGIACEVRDVTESELESAVEGFLTNSQFGVLPIRRCDDKEWAVGTITRNAQCLAATNGVPECSP